MRWKSNCTPTICRSSVENTILGLQNVLNRLNCAFLGKSDKKMRCKFKDQLRIKKRRDERADLRSLSAFYEVNVQEIVYKKELMRFQSFCRPRLQFSSVVCFFVGVQNV